MASTPLSSPMAPLATAGVWTPQVARRFPTPGLHEAFNLSTVDDQPTQYILPSPSVNRRGRGSSVEIRILLQVHSSPSVTPMASTPLSSPMAPLATAGVWTPQVARRFPTPGLHEAFNLSTVDDQPL
ncbi:uncharacterized protein FYW47_015663 [Aplochiton taeniatus]